jgi:hypothetical protein
MLVSYRHNFLFIHVPKNAGTSIHEALAPWAEDPLRYWHNRLLNRVGIHVNHLGPHWGKRFRRHTPGRVIQNNMPEAVWRRLFKFAFVRNPWDRLVSQYHYILQTPAHHRNKRVQTMSFEPFLDYWTQGERASQLAMVTDARGNIIIDFIGRCERIADDFPEVCRTLQLDVKLPHINSSGQKDYRRYYNDDTAALVAQRLAADIKFFNYTFDPQPHSSAAFRRAA